MSLPKPIQLSIAISCGAVILLFAPLCFFMASNLGSGLFNLALNRKPTRDELVGKYSYQAKWGTASLQLDQTGDFRETINEAGKPQRTVTGTWETRDTGSNFLDVGLKPFGMVWDEDHETQTAGFGTQFYKRRNGAVYGLIDDDLGEQFTRQ